MGADVQRGKKTGRQRSKEGCADRDKIKDRQTESRTLVLSHSHWADEGHAYSMSQKREIVEETGRKRSSRRRRRRKKRRRRMRMRRTRRRRIRRRKKKERGRVCEREIQRQRERAQQTCFSDMACCDNALSVYMSCPQHAVRVPCCGTEASQGLK